MTYSFISPLECNEGLLGPNLTTVCSASQFFVFISLFDALMRSVEKISETCERVKPVETTDDTYDFIVVGGGAGGSVVASRLSENADCKVLLLEAGPDEPVGTQIPSFVGKFLSTDIIYDYKTTNETHACLSTNGSCRWPSGRNLGGNTVHNAMIYIRGNPTDYENWVNLGCEGWGYNDVLEFFKKSENNGEIDRVGRKYHGSDGPLSVQRFSYLPDLAQSFLDAAEEVGYGVSDDLNGDQLTGFSRSQTMNKHGVRHSSASAFLRPVRNRKNLHISLNSYVTRLIIVNKTAVGVEYYKDGEFRTVYATKEVIVCGGAMESPHLLLLSGIGPKQHLESVGVDVVLDLPGVGQNFHDHVCPVINFTINEPDTYESDYKVAIEYATHQTGPMASTGISQVFGILASNSTASDFPDIQINFAGIRATCAPGEINAIRSTGLRNIFIFPTFLHPKSRGTVTLASKDPFKLPVLWANYMGDPSDIDHVVQGIKMALALVDSEALRRHNFTISDIPVAACANYTYKSDEYWACAAQQINYFTYHMAGSCKMGNATDPMAVVDPWLRVYGIKGLRVADASIMPQVISGNTAAPTMMIGERAADFIKKYWGYKISS